MLMWRVVLLVTAACNCRFGMHVRFRHRPVVVRQHRASVLGGLPPTGIPWINSLVHRHHRRLAHILVPRLHHRSLILIRWIIIWRPTAHVHAARPHLVTVHAWIHAFDIAHVFGKSVIVRIHINKSTQFSCGLHKCNYNYKLPSIS